MPPKNIKIQENLIMNAFLATFLPFISAQADFTDLSDSITELIDSMWVPCVSVASALAVAWGIFLGVKYWLSAGDEQKKKSAKSAIISFVVGVIVIFAVAVGAPLGIGALSEWAGAQSVSTVAATAAL